MGCGAGLGEDRIVMCAGWMITPLLAQKALQRKLCVQKTVFWDRRVRRLLRNMNLRKKITGIEVTHRLTLQALEANISLEHFGC